jgi:hypothetical protein
MDPTCNLYEIFLSGNPLLTHHINALLSGAEQTGVARWIAAARCPGKPALPVRTAGRRLAFPAGLGDADSISSGPR